MEHSGTWMNFKAIMLGEISQTLKEYFKRKKKKEKKEYFYEVQEEVKLNGYGKKFEKKKKKKITPYARVGLGSTDLEES